MYRTASFDHMSTSLELQHGKVMPDYQPDSVSFSSATLSPFVKQQKQLKQLEPYGFPMVPLTHLVSLWFPYGFPMVYLWFTYGLPMVSL